MGAWSTTAAEIGAAFVLALGVAGAARWVARRAARQIARRISQRSARSPLRLAVSDDRLLTRADGIARLVSRLISAVAYAIAILYALQRSGIDLVLAISSAGFLGLALALSGQDLIRDILAGTRSMVEDRYAIGDRVTARVDGADITGTIDVIGAATVRIRTDEGATCHLGHDAIRCLTNHSQRPAMAIVTLADQDWQNAEPADATARLAAASNDVGLTGVVFVGDVVKTHQRTESGEVDVAVSTNRPLNSAQIQAVKHRLMAPSDGDFKPGETGRG